MKDYYVIELRNGLYLADPNGEKPSKTVLRWDARKFRSSRNARLALNHARKHESFPEARILESKNMEKETKPLKTEEDYKKAVVRMEGLGDEDDFESNSNAIKEFEHLEKLVESYELEHYSLDDGKPIEIKKLKQAYKTMSKKIKFWYESNAYFGWVHSLKGLKRAYEHNNDLGRDWSLDDFLDRSTECRGNKRIEYGTRREHHGGRSLRVYLKEKGWLEDFLELFENPSKD